jgi:CubicO group peptidase (beta-lactamase class C family)
MKQTQFRILYRQFLFRMVDLELLSADAQGDTSKLFGRFAALLVSTGVLLALAGLLIGGATLSPAARLVVEWSGVHFMIATTMLVVGLFAILSWDSTFPDKRDVMVLAPLPVRSRTIFFAKVAAVATALGVAVGILHFLAGFAWSLSLNNRHAAVIAPSIAYNAPMAPVDVADLEPVLKHDLEPAFRSGVFAPGTGGGATVGVWKRGKQRVFAYGTAKPDSLFEIGSITKTFTALALAQLVVQGKVRLDEPVRGLLPPDTVKEPNAREMTLLDLATHRSGLPRMPNNLHSTDPQNPFADYNTADLYAFMKYWGVGKEPWAAFEYSNLGFGLLGQVLENRAGGGYADLVRGITGPLGMRDTVIDLSPEKRARLIQGYAAPHTPVGPMDLGAFAGAGAIRSTAADMLRYLTANLHPPNGLRAAIEEQHKLRAQVVPGTSIALAWVYDARSGIYEHDGGTSGYTSYAFFSPKGDYAVVVLTNVGPDLFEFVGILGEHIRERLTGERAISLNTALIPAGGGGVLDFLRLLAVWWVTMLVAGAFIYCCVLGAQGLAAQLLPRRHFLRVSSWMQLAAFGIFLAAYFLEPKLVTPVDLINHESSAYIEWSPSYWFLGLFQQVNGSPALPELALRGWIAIAVAFGATASAYTLAYFRTLQKIVEEPDITPAAAGRSWLPRFGNRFATAIGQFSIRTLLRSRQHRLLLAFYLGIGFAAAILFKKSDEAPGATDAVPQLSALCSTMVMMILWVVGMRVVFSLPIDMRANWIFRTTPTPPQPQGMIARRRALYTLSVVPVCLGSAALLFSIWPWQAAAKHLVVLVLMGIILAELCLRGTQKLPFTCSYLPGKQSLNVMLQLSGMVTLPWIVKTAQLERDSFDHAANYAAMVGVLAVLAIGARWSAARLAKSEEGALKFEDAMEPAIFALDLHRDGVTPIALPPGSGA